MSCITNKKGNPRGITGIFGRNQSPIMVEMFSKTDKNCGSLCPAYEKDGEKFINNLRKLKKFVVLFPFPKEPERYLMSRFICKVALEALVLRVINIPEGVVEIVEKEELDPIREYARNGAQNIIWEYKSRKIYDADTDFYEPQHGEYTIPHEWTFLYTPESELFFVLALFGVEYVVNMGDPKIDSYKKWLSQNFYKSPLYPKWKLER